MLLLDRKDERTLGMKLENLLQNAPFASVLDREVLAGEVLEAVIDREERTLSLTVAFSALTVREALRRVEGYLTESLSVKSARISPRYPQELFSSDYFPQIIEELKRRDVLVNGFFNDCSVDFLDNKLTVYLSHGGYAVLKKARCEQLIRSIVAEEFSLDIQAAFDGVLELEDYSKDFSVSQQQADREGQELQARRHQEMQAQAAADAAAARAYAPRAQSSSGYQPGNGGSPASNGAAPVPSAGSRSAGAGPVDVTVILGRAIKDPPIPLGTVTQESGRVTVKGEIFNIEKKETRDGSKVIYTFYITDYTGSNTLKVIQDREKCELLDTLSEGQAVLVRGDVSYDKYDREIAIRPYDISLTNVLRQSRKDTAEQKRVELHCHTNMSAMDGMSSAGDIIKCAHKWGHKAIAITDHGVAQAFPDVMNAVSKIKKAGGEFKPIYGTECYFVNDMIPAVYRGYSYPFSEEIVVFDIETTGLSASTDRMTEIGAVKIKGGEIIDTFNTFVNPGMPIPKKITELTGITDKMVADAPSEQEAMEKFYAFCRCSRPEESQPEEAPQGKRHDYCPLVAHNAPFDTSFIQAAAKRGNMPFDFAYIDTVPVCRKLFPNLKKHRLNDVADHLQLGGFNHHRASDDATVLAKILFRVFDWPRRS